MDDVATAGKWEALRPSLSPPILSALKACKFSQMTPVQLGTVPLFMGNKDVVVEAVTGSGKTLAFVIPVLEKLLRRDTALLKNEIGALIIAPTRELAKQIHDVFSTFLEHINKVEEGRHLHHTLFIGGNNVTEDVQDFAKNGADIIIGTPGRLEDLLKRGNVFVTKELEVLVMDEADRLLDMGFEASLNAIITRLPKQRRTGLFSATMSEGLNELVRAGLRNPARIVVKVENHNKGMEGQKTPSTLDVGYVICDADQKLSQLIHLLRKEADSKFMVYFCTCACVDYFFKALSTFPHLKGYTLFSLHGKMDPKRREAVYEKFANSPSKSILLCTDVAARGLDMPDIDWVIQFDPPQDPKSFTHRCGRTARLGREGNALVFLTPQEDTYVEFLKIRKVPMRQFSLVPDDEGSVTGGRITAAGVLELLRKANAGDRDIFEKSAKAFVSWVRSYNEHQASYIFQFKEVDLAAAARSFGLLRLPKMPELKNKKIDFTPTDININDIRYKDKVREKQRQARLLSIAEKEKADSAAEKTNAAENLRAKKRKTAGAGEAWSEQKQIKERRQERREKKGKRREAIAKAKVEGTFVPKVKAAGEKAVGQKRKSAALSDNDSSDDSDEWAVLQKEAREMKKEKKSAVIEKIKKAQQMKLD